MSAQTNVPTGLQAAVQGDVLARLPITFLPFVNQQIREWELAFPHEQRYLVRMLRYLGSLSREQFATLFRGVRDIEMRMDVSRWKFSTDVQTIENASLLARSPYYQEWRGEVQKVFDEMDRESLSRDGRFVGRRLILLIFPARLPLDSRTIWARWQGMGRETAIELPPAGVGQPMLDMLFGPPGREGGAKRRTFLEDFVSRHDRAADDCWVIEAGTEIGRRLEDLMGGAKPPRATFLSFERLKPFREGFLERINAIRRDLADADAVYAALREADVGRWCPPEVAARPEVREFVRSLFLSGNGALVFSNAFVEWAATEAFRRARPSVLVAHLGTRAKPKPFTSVAIFENQERANPLPAEEDLPGSALDAQIMAYYMGLAAGRFPEYQETAACVCLAEATPSAYVIAPPEFPLLGQSEPVPLDRIPSLLGTWLS